MTTHETIDNIQKNMKKIIGNIHRPKNLEEGTFNNLQNNLTKLVEDVRPENIETNEYKDALNAVNKIMIDLHSITEEEEEELKNILELVDEIKNLKVDSNLYKYFYNTMGGIKVKNNKLDDEIIKHKLEIEYRLNDIYTKDGTIDILKLLITGILLSLLVLALNKYIILDIPVINIISVILSIFLFLIIIRVITNRSKKPMNFRQFNYSENPSDYGFWSDLSNLILGHLPGLPKSRSAGGSNISNVPHGNV